MEVRVGGTYITRDGCRARITVKGVEKRGAESAATEMNFWIGAVIGAGRNEWTLGGIDRYGIKEWDLVQEISASRKSA